MKKQGDNEDFEFVKDDNDKKGNYIFQKDGITKTGAIIVIAFLVILILAVVFSGVLVDFNAIIKPLVLHNNWQIKIYSLQ